MNPAATVVLCTFTTQIASLVASTCLIMLSLHLMRGIKLADFANSPKMVPKVALLLAIVAIGCFANVAEASASPHEPAAKEDVKAFMDLKQQENSLKAQIKTLEADSASALEQMRRAQETARRHQAPGTEEVADKSPASHEVVLLETGVGAGVTVSSSSSLELTIAVAGDDSPELTVDSGSFSGSWATLTEGSTQFSDRSYALSSVPSDLIGIKYFKGPCHSGGATVTVRTSGTVYVLASKGNSQGKRDGVTISEASSRVDIGMDTGSFSVSGFERWTVAPVTSPTTPQPTSAPTPLPCEHHTGITGPEYPGLKLHNGSDASPTWYAPYQEHELRADLKALDCNPASCDNPSACGIPVCRGISDECAARWRGVERASCDGAGCDIEKYAQVVASTFPDDRNVQDVIDSTVTRSGQSKPMAATDAFPVEFLPGIRFGTYDRPKYTPGLVQSTPYSTDHTATGKNDGSWLLPDRRFCNPLGWLASSKLAIAHSGVSFDKRSGVIITKLAICLKANCAADDAACAPTKCYVSKKGKCVTFNQDVFEPYASHHAKTHSMAASALLKSGDYTAGCNEAAEDSSRSAISGN